MQATLASATAERDALKGQVTTLQTQLDAAKKDADDAKKALADIQAKAKEKGHPWDMGKGFDQSAVSGAISPVGAIGHPSAGRIWLKVNGDVRQDGDLSAMMWKVADIIANLSTMVRLEAGDLIYTGTPAGVGPVVPGDLLEAGVEGVGTLHARLV